MNRRDFLKRTAVQASVLTLVGYAGSARGQMQSETVDGQKTVRLATTAAATGFYTPNRAPLQPSPFMRLPPGSVKAAGWLKHQLNLQLEGLNGRMTEVSDYLNYDNCGWVNPDKVGWEELPYWLRGFGNLGYVTGDQRVLDTTRKWVDGILATQQSDGMFGPTRLRTSLEGGPDFWPGMPLLDAMRSFHEYHDDPRIILFMTKYFQFQQQQPGEVFGRSWAALRWADTLDGVFWLYNRTGDSWLLDFADKVHTHGADYTSGIPNWHNVNLAQGFREPAQYGLRAGQERFRQATYRNYKTIMQRYGQFPGGGFAGDENCRPGRGDPRQGFETCGIVEYMRSFEILTRITGDPIWGDRCEEITFNSMPAAFDPRQKGTHYITCANSIQLDNVPKKHGQFSNDFAMLAYMPGIHNYRCCPHNYGMGWPYFTEELWLASADGGLCASMYAACEVTAKVGSGGSGDGQSVTIVSSTDYPFKETVEFTLTTSQPVEFPLYLRIPRWCRGASVKINDTAVDIQPTPLSYVVLRRPWQNGDRISLRLPMETTVRSWQDNHSSVSVERGPLTYSLAIKENWDQIGGTETWPEYQVSAASPWNYGLRLGSSAASTFEVELREGALPENPWSDSESPIRLQTKAQRIEHWTADSENVVNPLQQSPTRSNETVETISLIPMGAARLRISAFPTINNEANVKEWQEPQT